MKEALKWLSGPDEGPREIANRIAMVVALTGRLPHKRVLDRWLEEQKDA